LTGVAGLYYFLNSPFVAMMELLIYVGAVCVAIIFAVMLAEPRSEDKVGKESGLGALFGVIAGGLVFFGIAAVGVTSTWSAATHKINQGTLTELGISLMTSYSMVFELISVVLLVAIIGALVLAHSGREKDREKS
jgi:NADH-quinone oxidoreductase subunit J